MTSEEREAIRALARRVEKQSIAVALLAQKLKVLYIQISTVGALLVGDIVAHTLK